MSIEAALITLIVLQSLQGLALLLINNDTQKTARHLEAIAKDVMRGRTRL